MTPEEFKRYIKHVGSFKDKDLEKKFRLFLEKVIAKKKHAKKASHNWRIKCYTFKYAGMEFVMYLN